MYKLTKSEVLQTLAASEGGLTSAEAEARRKIYGENRLGEGKKKSLAGLFFAQFKDLMTLILLGAAALSGAIAFFSRTPSELADTGILIAVILLNAVVGFVQEYRADSAIAKLKKLSAPTAKTVRDGKVTVLDAALLVPGDVIELAEGDGVPADCRILSSEGFRADEAALTGESRPVAKSDRPVTSSSLAERANTVHRGTFCVGGTARCVVTATGMQTEMGQIAGLLHSAVPVPSPLDKLVQKLGKLLTVTVFAVAALLFLCGSLARRVGILENLMTSVAVAVAAIPEGLGATVTVILAMGVRRLSKDRVVMRKLSAVETLGSCTCVCTDKTGTLTRNKMTVTAIGTDCAEEGYTGAPRQRRLLTCMRLCHTVRGQAGGYLGDPTEIALLEYADRVGFFAEGKRLGGIPFSSERKRMSVAAETEKGAALYVKGGAEAVLPLCTRAASGEGERPFPAEARERVLREISRFAQEGKRVLVFAEGAFRGEPREEELVYLGFAAMADPPKEGTKEAVAACRRAGVRTVMITGDSADTAFAVARQLGIAKDRGEIVTGEELDGMGEALSARAGEISVYARVSPKHKQQIVRALQARGEVVAMTGDGVNDAPSVRAADIGIAMGGGTDVTKDAADMVLTDGNFSSIVRALEEGRSVFAGVKRTISFFLATNLAEVLAVLVATLFLWRYDFLTSTQLLWINLITDSLPVLALGAERAGGTMEGPPVSAGELLSPASLAFMGTLGVLQAAATVGLFLYALHAFGNAAASSCAFFTLSFSELFHAFNVRKEHGVSSPKEMFSDPVLLLTAALGILLNVLLTAEPFLSRAFGVVPLTGVQWALVFACSLAVIPLGELYKAAEGVAVRRSLRPRRGKRPLKSGKKYTRSA